MQTVKTAFRMPNLKGPHCVLLIRRLQFEKKTIRFPSQII